MKELLNGGENYNKYKRLNGIEQTVNVNNVKVKNEYAACCLRSLSWWLLVGAAALLTITLMKVGYISKDIIYHQQLTSLHVNDEVKHAEENSADTNSLPGQAKVVSCYYNLPSEYGSRQLMPTDIHPYLCTHINVGFAVVQNKEIKLEDYHYRLLTDVEKLKQKDPHLKILLSVGGAGNDRGFSDMVIDHASRKTFIKSLKNILRNTTLDGVDLDWEFPSLHKRERQHFSQLLREIRMEFIREKRDYLLTVATAAPQTIVDISYDIDELNQYVDYVNIMTYDFHFYTKYTPFTGFNSPLFARPTEHMYLATLNINYTVNMYINKGLKRDKIVVGIPTYGHTYSLVNADNAEIGSPASGFGSLGASGFINYPDVCLFIKQFTSDVTVKFDDAAKVPYLYRNKEWVSYDSPRSVMDKANFIKRNRLRGAMIYSLNADDYEGVCAREAGGDAGAKFPLLRSVKSTLLFD